MESFGCAYNEGNGKQKLVLAQDQDTISCVRFSPTTSKIYQLDNDVLAYFAFSAWDGNVHIYKILATPAHTIYLLHKVSLPGPVLSLSWRLDCPGLLLSHSDGNVYSVGLSDGKLDLVAAHGSEAVIGAY